MMTATQVQEQINIIINKAMANLGSGAGTLSTPAQIATILTNAATAVTTLNTNGVTHSRAIQDHGTVLNPSQP